MVLAGLSVVLASTFGSSFLPSFREGTFNVFLMAPPGTSLAESDRLAGSIERQLMAVDGVHSVTRRTGRAERDEHAEPVSNSEIEVTVDADADQEAVREAIDRIVRNIPSISVMVGQPIEHRLSHVLSGTPAAIAISIYGDDLDTLRGVARKVETALRTISGTRDVAANREVMITSLPIRYRPAALAVHGLSPADAAEQVQEALQGVQVASVNHGIRRFDMVVRLAESERQRLDQVMDLRLRGSGGGLVRLRDVADIGPERTSNLITRENTQRKALVTTNVGPGHDLGGLVAAVRSQVDPIVREAGCTVHYGGQFEAQQSASRTIWMMGAGIVVVMFLLLQASTGGASTAALVMLNLPLALIGGVIAVFVSESPDIGSNAAALLGLGENRYVAPVLSIASMVGFVTLFGIAVRNGILLVNHYEHLRTNEGCSVQEAVVRGSVERLCRSPSPGTPRAASCSRRSRPSCWAGCSRPPSSISLSSRPATRSSREVAGRIPSPRPWSKELRHEPPPPEHALRPRCRHPRTGARRMRGFEACERRQGRREGRPRARPRPRRP
jgi:HME family heavy-metal exporter